MLSSPLIKIIFSVFITGLVITAVTMWMVRAGLNRLTKGKILKNIVVGHHGTPNI